MTKNTLTSAQKELVKEALFYYRDEATHSDKEHCGLDGRKRRIMNQAIEKIERLI